MTKVTRVGGSQWFMALVLVVGAVAAPTLQAQEMELPVDTTEVRERPAILSLGLRLEFVGLASPGASVHMTLIPGRLWLSLEYLAQMMRTETKLGCGGRYDPHTRRDHLHIGRLAAGVGRGEGLSAFVFFESGAGVIKTRCEPAREDTYGLSGVGLGAGYTAGRVTTALDLSIGVERNVPSPYFYGLLGISLRFRLF